MSTDAHRSTNDVACPRRRVASSSYGIASSIRVTIRFAVALTIGLAGNLVPGSALAAGAFGTPQCVTVVDTTIGMVGVMPPGSLDRNDTTLFPVGSADKMPPVKVGDLVEVEPAREGGAMTPTFRTLQPAAVKCAEVTKASEAEAAHHAGHGHDVHQEPAPSAAPAPTTAP